MIPSVRSTPSEVIADIIIQHAEEIEKVYGIYLDESITRLIIQAFNMVFESMVYQTKLIKENEER